MLSLTHQLLYFMKIGYDWPLKSLRSSGLRSGAAALALLSMLCALLSMGNVADAAHASPQDAPVQASVIDVTSINAKKAAETLHTLFPRIRIQVDAHSNAVLVIASPDQLQQIRSIVQGIDIRDPQASQVEVIPLHVVQARWLAARLRPLYRNAQVSESSKYSLIVRATPAVMSDIKTLIASLDVAAPSVSPSPKPAAVFAVTQADPRGLARALSRDVDGLKVSVSGSSVILAGSQEQIDQAKTLAQDLDKPAYGAKFPQIYRLHSADASSVGDLITRSFPDVKVTVDSDLNSLSVVGTSTDQQRIASALTELDAQSNGQSGGGDAAYGDGNIAVVDLQNAIPGQNGSSSTSAQDIASAVQQALASTAPDLHVTVPANSSQILLVGNPTSLKLAKDLITKLDEPQPLVVLDTEVLEVDENSARDVGLEMPGATLSTTFQEIEPTPDPITGQPGKLGRLQSLTRTPLQFTAELNTLVQNGNARVLADPRVTTLSGHTATIRAGDTIGILTQTGGGVGTPVTQQLQTFQTGVTLDITPEVNPSGNVVVALHPVVNSLEGILNGVPQIATRDTQTIVQLDDNQTLVIGGLIQETLQHSVSKIPLLGDIPLVGKIFQNSDTQRSRNELVIVVTPHVLWHGKPALAPSSALPAIPTPIPDAMMSMPSPQPLPTVPGIHIGHNAGTRRTPQPITIAPGAPQLSPATNDATPTPAPAPSAFSKANTFVYGAPPANTYASDTDAPKIFYAELSPTVVEPGTPVQIFVVTTSNVQKVQMKYLNLQSTLSQVAPAKWQGAFTLDGAALSSSDRSFSLTLSASNGSGAAATIEIPMNVIKKE